MSKITESHLIALKSAAVANYKSMNFSDWQLEAYENEFNWTVGKKYIKILNGSSVWGFIVNVDNDKKFPIGTILKPAGWSTPARNFSRGNVLSLNPDTIGWTGAGDSLF